MQICTRCGYPLIFRHWGRNPHQPFHIPSGWHCWSWGKKDENAPVAERMALAGGGETSVEYWEALKREGLDAYDFYRRNGEMEPFLAIVAREVEAGNDRMVENLLEELLYQVTPGPKLNSLLRQVIASDAWTQLWSRAEAVARGEDEPPTEPPTAPPAARTSRTPPGKPRRPRPASRERPRRAPAPV